MTTDLIRLHGVKEFLRKLSETVLEKESVDDLLSWLCFAASTTRVVLDTWVLMVSLLCTEVEEYWEEEGMEEDNSALSKSFASCKQSMMF